MKAVAIPFCIGQTRYPLTRGEIAVVKRIFACIKGAEMGIMPGDKPYTKAVNLLLCAPSNEALKRRQDVIRAINIQEFYYKRPIRKGYQE